MINQVLLGDCLDVMGDIPDRSIDMILCDLPYGTTACKWDSVIPFEPLWAHYKRMIKPNGAIVLTASQPFTSALVMSNVEWFKYDWIWQKSCPTGFMNAAFRPLKSHESILVFSQSRAAFNQFDPTPAMPYNPQGVLSIMQWEKGKKRATAGNNTRSTNKSYLKQVTNYPRSVLQFSNPNKGSLHPTQKPVPLFEYLVRTYTNEGETVLDNCIGSGTTAIAAINTGRNFIGIEKDEEYYQIACDRIEKHREMLLNTPLQLSI